MELNIDINELTIDDVVDLEEAIGQPIQVILDKSGDAPQGKALKALIWIAKRKEDPSFTFADAGKVSFAELTSDVEATELDPPDGGGSTSD